MRGQLQGFVEMRLTLCRHILPARFASKKRYRLAVGDHSTKPICKGSGNSHAQQPMILWAPQRLGERLCYEAVAEFQLTAALVEVTWGLKMPRLVIKASAGRYKVHVVSMV
jgi:hypothetical protein